MDNENIIDSSEIFDQDTRNSIQLALDKAESNKSTPPVGVRADEGYIRPESWYAPGLGMVKVGSLDFDTIDRMLLNGQVNFAYMMKVAPLISRFRNRDTWRFTSSDTKLAILAEHALKRFLFFSIGDMSTSLMYGVSFNEVVWKLRTKEELAIDNPEIPKGYKVWVPEPVVPIHPKSVLKVLYTKPTDTKPKEFNGFEMLRSDGKKITIDRERALVITHNKRFKSIWGQSILEPAYVYWFFYEQIWRAAMKYYERIGQPVVVVHYPSRETYTVNGQTITAAEYALMIGADASVKTVLAIPSDPDIDPTGGKGSPKWRIEFLQESLSSDAGTMFDQAFKRLEEQIQRALLLADRSVSQDSKYGSYALAEVHQEATTADTESRLLEMVAQVERYLLPKFAKYNGGNEAATLYVEVDPLDQTTTTQKRNIFGTLLNVHPQMPEIDFRGLGEEVGVPFMDIKEIQAMNEEKIKQTKAMQEALKPTVEQTDSTQKDTTTDNKKDNQNSENLKSDTKTKKNASKTFETVVQSGMHSYVNESGNLVFEVPFEGVSDFMDLYHEATKDKE